MKAPTGRNFFGFVAFLLPVLGVALVGCQKASPSSPEEAPLGDPFRVSAWAYSHSYFFLDTLFFPIYERYLQPDSVAPPLDIDVRRVEVYAQRTGPIPDPNERLARSYAVLPARGAGYGDNLRSGPDILGEVESAPVVRLIPGVDYSLLFEGRVGIIRLNSAFSDWRLLAASYSTGWGQVGEFGTDVQDLPPDMCMILKLIKPRQAFANGAAFRHSWPLVVKNIYPIGFTEIDRTGFQCQLVLTGAGGTDQAAIAGHALLEVVGLDRYAGSQQPGHDGEFDFISGRTIDRDRGEIILPWVRPFDTGIRAYFAHLGVPVPDSTHAVLPGLYDSDNPERDLQQAVVQKTGYFLIGRAVHF